MQGSQTEQLNKLILSVAEGYADCLDGIYAIAGGKMYAVALSIVGKSCAEDVLHDSFIKIARFAKKYRRDTDPYGWLIKIVKNTALDCVKANKRHPLVDLDIALNLTDSGYSHDRTDGAIALESALKSLDRDEQRVIYCVYYLDMTVRETAAELSLSKSSVQRTKERAEEKLKNLLGGGTK